MDALVVLVLLPLLLLLAARAVWRRRMAKRPERHAEPDPDAHPRDLELTPHGVVRRGT